MRKSVFRIVVVVALTVAGVAATPSAGAAEMSIRSSEPLPPAGGIDYDAAKLTDRDIRTAWCVKGGSASPAWFFLRFEKPTPLPVLGWFGGYQKSDRVFRANARPRTVAAYADGRPLGRFALDDRTGLQRLELPVKPAREYSFTIEAAYPGAKYDDLCLTEVLTDKQAVAGYQLIEEFAGGLGNGAAGRVEIAEYSRVYDFWRSFFDEKWNPIDRSGDGPYWDAIVLRASARDEASLRFILNLDEYHSRLKIVHSELLEGLRDTVIWFIADNASMVADLWADNDQAGRNTIESALYMFVDPWKPGQINERRRTDPGFDRLVRMVCKTHTEKAHYCGGD